MGTKPFTNPWLLSVGWTTSRSEYLVAGSTSYSKLSLDLITFCIGLVKGKYPTYVHNLPRKQKSAVKLFLHAPQSPQADTQGPLQKLLYRLFTQEASTTGERYRLTVYLFLIVSSFCKEGNIDWCGSITQRISKLVFLGRCAIYQKIWGRMEKDEQGFFSYVISHFPWPIPEGLPSQSPRSLSKIP